MNKPDLKNMNNEEFKAFTKGRWFGCGFIKKDGTLREYKGCRTDVKKYTNGGHNNVESNKPHMVTVWPNRQDKQYRTLNLQTIKTFTFGGVTYEY